MQDEDLNKSKEQLEKELEDYKTMVSVYKLLFNSLLGLPRTENSITIDGNVLDTVKEIQSSIFAMEAKITSQPTIH